MRNAAFVSDRHRGKKGTTIRALAFRDRERRRNDRRRRVHRRSLVNVVELEDVRRDAIRERGSRVLMHGRTEHRRVARTPKPRGNLLREPRRLFNRSAERRA
jgi:hypothetical protein